MANFPGQEKNNFATGKNIPEPEIDVQKRFGPKFLKEKKPTS